jgi:Polysaccharide deacetylase
MDETTQQAGNNTNSFLLIMVFFIAIGVAIFGGYVFGSSYRKASMTTLNTAPLYPSPQSNDQKNNLQENRIDEGTVSTDGATSAYGKSIVVSKINTKRKVVFLTMDDGLVKKPEALDYILQKNLKPTLFLDDEAIRDNYDYFLPLLKRGSTVQNHTVAHPNLTTMSLSEQTKEVCAANEKLETAYQAHARLLRPPYGAYNEDTKKAAEACGLDVIVNWSAKVNGGRSNISLVLSSFLAILSLCTSAPPSWKTCAPSMKKSNSKT